MAIDYFFPKIFNQRNKIRKWNMEQGAQARRQQNFNYLQKI